MSACIIDAKPSGVKQAPDRFRPSCDLAWPWIDEGRKEGRLMSQPVVIRRSGNLIELSPDGKSGLPPHIRNLIEPHLTYTYQRLRRGLDRRDPITGYDRGPIEFSERPLYKYDGNGRLCCGVGFLPKIKDLLRTYGADLKVIECDDLSLKKGRYDEDWDSVVREFQFRPKQQDCLVQIASHEYGVIQAPTGFGKGAIIAMACILYPKAKIHVITPSKDLVEKSVRFLTKYIPSVGQVGCGRKDSGRVTVFSADSLHLSDGSADIVLADEIHKLAAPTYSEELAKYRHSRNFGFSATPEGRMDGADAKLESLFGPKIFSLPYQEAVDLGLVVPIVVDWVDIKLDTNPCEGKRETAKKRWGIWRNDARNELIAKKVLSFPEQDQVLVLVETIEHLMFLRKHLPGFVACYSENGLKKDDVNMYKRWGLMDLNEEPINARQRDQLRRDFEEGKVKKAIATGVWATGVDFVSLSVLVRADALGSEIMDIQAPGRVSRVAGDGSKRHGIVVDCMDQFDATFRRKANGRRNSYKRNGWAQIHQ